MDSKARCAVVHEVVKSWTRLNDWTELKWCLVGRFLGLGFLQRLSGETSVVVERAKLAVKKLKKAVGMWNSRLVLGWQIWKEGLVAGGEIAGQAQSSDRICVHHHPFHLVTAEGWTQVVNGLWGDSGLCCTRAWHLPSGWELWWRISGIDLCRHGLWVLRGIMFKLSSVPFMTGWCDLSRYCCALLPEGMETPWWDSETPVSGCDAGELHTYILTG